MLALITITHKNIVLLIMAKKKTQDLQNYNKNTEAINNQVTIKTFIWFNDTKWFLLHLMYCRQKCLRHCSPLTTLENNLSVSRSSRILLCFVVIRSMYSFSSGWYTYRTLSVSTNVCCLPVLINLGNAANKPSILDRVISTNCRDMIAVENNSIKLLLVDNKLHLGTV